MASSAASENPALLSYVYNFLADKYSGLAAKLKKKAEIVSILGDDSYLASKSREVFEHVGTVPTTDPPPSCGHGPCDFTGLKTS